MFLQSLSRAVQVHKRKHPSIAAASLAAFTSPSRAPIPRQDAIMQQRGNRDLFSANWITKLTNRSVISIRGRDATDLLQNTST